MTHTIHDISVANHIGKYSDAIAVTAIATKVSRS